MHKHALQLALGFAALAAAGTAGAASDLTGIWLDHTGRGAVEITECGANLCGRLVWLKDGANKNACGTQIIGNAKPVGKDTWDGGWIYDPEKNEKYSVELKPIGSDKLRVLGYMGSKLFSETMIWKRASVDLRRCDAAEPNATASPTPRDKSAPRPPPVDTAPKTPAAEAGKGNPTTNQKPAGDATNGKTAAQPGKALDCRKYVAQIGEMIAVPCER